MDLPPGIAVRDRALLLEDTIVVADLHLGRGTSDGFELPIGDGADVLDRFRALVDDQGPATVVVAGDLLHSFGTVPHTVQSTLDGLADAVDEAGGDLVVTPGNHDTMLDAVWDGAPPATYRVGDTVICHGHEAPAVDDPATVERYVVGHDHPTIEIEGRRRPCFLLGERTADDATLVMLPAFNRLLRGVAVNDVRPRDLQSPLCRRVDDLAPVVRDDRAGDTLVFPPLGEFRNRL